MNQQTKNYQLAKRAVKDGFAYLQITKEEINNKHSKVNNELADKISKLKQRQYENDLEKNNAMQKAEEKNNASILAYRAEIAAYQRKMELLQLSKAQAGTQQDFELKANNRYDYSIYR